MNNGFGITCNIFTIPPRAFLYGYNIQIFSMLDTELRIDHDNSMAERLKMIIYLKDAVTHATMQRKFMKVNIWALVVAKYLNNRTF